MPVGINFESWTTIFLGDDFRVHTYLCLRGYGTTTRQKFDKHRKFEELLQYVMLIGLYFYFILCSINTDDYLTSARTDKINSQNNHKI